MAGGESDGSNRTARGRPGVSRADPPMFRRDIGRCRSPLPAPRRPLASLPVTGRFPARAIAASTTLALVALAQVAPGHTGLPGYTSRVLDVTPAAPGLEISVLGGDDRVYLYNPTRAVVIVRGYAGEPYLRIGPQGVDRNMNSPATYQNLDRYAERPLPPRARVSAAPAWRHLGAAPAVSWHDHRAHWMNRVPPVAVRNDPGARHHIQDWTIPLVVDGRRVSVTGTLDYAPPPGTGRDGGRGTAVYLWPAFAGSALLLAGITLVAVRRRRPR